MSRRGVGAYLLVFLVLGLVGTAAYLTRHPESPLVERATTWPVVGAWARRFREAYLERPPQPAGPAAVEEQPRPGVGPVPSPGAGPVPSPEVIVVPVDVDRYAAKPQIWVQPGTAVHERPDEESPVLERIEATVNLSLLERRGSWYRVRRTALGPDGWVFLEDYREPASTAPARLEPVLPMPAATPDPAVVETARGLLGRRARMTSCGPYQLLAAGGATAFARLCARIANRLDRAYEERYGVRPVGAPGGLIVLFESRDGYAAFHGGSAPLGHGHADAAAGVVAILAQGAGGSPVGEALAHELVHLTNRRALGPFLPPWLEQGLAADLAGVIAGSGARAGTTRLWERTRAGAPPDLRRLVDLSHAEFHRASVADVHYAESRLLVEFLLSDRELRPGFLAFLAGLAAGGPYTPDLLQESLDESWPRLEASFRAWLGMRYLDERVAADSAATD